MTRPSDQHSILQCTTLGSLNKAVGLDDSLDRKITVDMNIYNKRVIYL